MPTSEQDKRIAAMIGLSKAALDALGAPTVIIDAEKVEANLARAQNYADQQGPRLRPHIKTHKMPHLAARQVELGAVGITCQKLVKSRL